MFGKTSYNTPRALQHLKGVRLEFYSDTQWPRRTAVDTAGV